MKTILLSAVAGLVVRMVFASNIKPTWPSSELSTTAPSYSPPTNSPSAATTYPTTASYQVCAIDPIYLGLFSNTYIQYDASTFCLSLLGASTVTSCLSTSITRKTVAPTTIITDTRTITTTMASITSTVTTTAIAFDLALSASASTISLPSTTARAYPPSKRQFLDGTLEEARSSLSSACACNPSLSAFTDNIICSTTLTVSQTTVLRTFTTVLVTATSGVTTVTETSSWTSKISPSPTVPTITTWPSPSDVSCQDISWGPWNGWQPFTTESGPVTESSSLFSPSWTTWLSPTSYSTTSSATVSSTTATTTMMAIPSGCPYSNGTLFKENADNCTYYERICGRSYSEKDYFNFVAGYDTPEECTGLCDALNRGSLQSCLGIVWTTANDTHANCRALRSLSWPIDDNNSIALLIKDYDRPYCKPKSSTNVSTATSTTTTWTFSNDSMIWTTTSSSQSPYSTTTTITTSSVSSTEHYTSATDTSTTTTYSASTKDTTGYTSTGTGTSIKSTTCPTITVTNTLTMTQTQPPVLSIITKDPIMKDPIMKDPITITSIREVQVPVTSTVTAECASNDGWYGYYN